MENIEIIKKAIDSGFDAEVKNIYKVLSSNILTAGGSAEQIQDAKDKFVKGLTHANSVKAAALSSLS